MGGGWQSEKFWATSLAVVVLFLAALPYLLGYSLAPPDKEFGGMVMNFDDADSYLAKMLQGQRGAWLYQIPFTSEEHEGAFIGTFYFFWGWMARLTGWPLMVWWHLARLLCGGLLLLIAYLFVAHFLADMSRRLFAYALAILGSGWGWVSLLRGEEFITDFGMPEAHPFFTLLTFPHFSFAISLLLATFLLVLFYLRRGSPKYILAGGLTVLLVTTALPYLTLVLFWILALYLMILALRHEGPTRQRILGLWPVFIFPALPLSYYVLVLTTNPVFRAWWDQAATPSPSPEHYALGFGLILLLALAGFKDAWREKESAFLLAWTLGIIPLLYSPMNPQRRMLQGVHLPLSILATLATYNHLLPWLEKSGLYAKIVSFHPERYNLEALRRFTLVLLVLFTTLSNLYILGSLGVTMFRGDYPFFREKREIEAVDWLAAHTSSDEVVLASYETGSYIPAGAGNRVFLGHWAETKNFQDKFAEADRFFMQETEDGWRIEFLRRYGINYIFFGPREEAIGGFQPQEAPYLEEIFANPLVSIYKVRTDQQ